MKERLGDQVHGRVEEGDPHNDRAYSVVGCGSGFSVSNSPRCSLLVWRAAAVRRSRRKVFEILIFFFMVERGIVIVQVPVGCHPVVEVPGLAGGFGATGSGSAHPFPGVDERKRKNKNREGAEEREFFFSSFQD